MYETNHVPPLDMKTSTTGCCPKFNPKHWDGQTIVLENKNFVKAPVRSFLFMPLNFGAVVARTWAAIEKAGAKDPQEFVMLSEDVSPWKSYQYFWATKEVAGLDNVKLSGKFLCKVFEGQFNNAKYWYDEMHKLGVEKGSGDKPEIYFYYTTCPKCAKVYGKKYVVGLVKIG